MTFPAGILDELRARLDLSEVIGRKVTLTRRAGAEYVGLCPFHNDTTTSFVVHSVKGFYHCFGCGEHGDAIGFVMKTEGLSHTESVEKLAREVGLSSTPPRLYVFADEAGNFDFSRNRGASKYFIVATVISSGCRFGAELLDLHREMSWQRKPVQGSFHATTDAQAVRDEVFSYIMRQDFEVQATIMEKSKAQPQVRTSESTFYQYGWHYHFRHGLAKRVRKADEVMITVASMGTRKKRADFSEAVRRVVSQYDDRPKLVLANWPAQSDPCLQFADYCTWAIQRKWEQEDSRSYELIKDRISYEFNLWKRGTVHQY